MRKIGTKNPGIIGVHIGNLLAEKMKEQRISKSELSRKIARPPSAIAPLLKRPSMQAYLLWELSIALHYDFFAHLSEVLIEKTGQQIVSGKLSDKNTIAAMGQEIERLREERDYLKKMIDIMAK